MNLTGSIADMVPGVTYEPGDWIVITKGVYRGRMYQVKEHRSPMYDVIVYNMDSVTTRTQFCKGDVRKASPLECLAMQAE